MTKNEKKILSDAVEVMRALLRISRKPIVTRRGNALIDKFIKSFEPAKKPPIED